MQSNWYYSPDRRKKLGPFTLEQMRGLARRGKLQSSHLVRRDGAERWSPAGNVEGLFPSRPHDDRDAGAAEPRRDRRRPRAEAGLPPLFWAMLGAGGVLTALLFLGLAVWWGLSGDPSVSQEEPAPPARATAALAGWPVLARPVAPPNPPARLSLPELFVRLAPAVPLVEAVEAGSGSGCLVRHQGRYLVLTNRHVIENARQGVAVHFLQGDGRGDERRFTVPREHVSVVAVHRAADLAVLDVSAASGLIAGQRVEALALAPPRHRPQVGERVFAIGHPGGGAAGQLTRTLSDGIVSAVGRRQDEASFHQVTVPINPGNSGGPLFDLDGRVVGINTFIIRKSQGRDISLEGLGFALESDFLHEVLTDPSRSLGRREIAALLNPAPIDMTPLLVALSRARVQAYLDAGYSHHGGSARAGTRVIRVPARRNYTVRVRTAAGVDFAAVGVARGAPDIDLAVVDEGTGRVVAADFDPDPTPEVRFRAARQGYHRIVILNPTNCDALVVLTLLRKS
jgi:S1-C subfamily serine protease